MVVKIMVPFLGSYYMTAPSISGTQKGTLILTPPNYEIKVETCFSLVISIPWHVSRAVLLAFRL